MHFLFENSDAINNPYEAFKQDIRMLGAPIKPHWHYFAEIIYVTEGCGMMEYDDRSYSVETGDLLIFPPKVVHSVYATTHVALKYDVIKFDANMLTVNSSYTPRIASILETVRTSSAVSPIFHADELAGIPIDYFFNACINELNSKEYGYDIQVHSLICAIIVHLLRVWAAKGFSPKTAPVTKDTDADIDNITEYIDAHSGDNILVEDLAVMCNMSYSYFAKRFREIYGKTCKEYIEFIRICKADDMLLFTDYPLDYISQEMGFTDSSHFIKTYKKFRNITPKQRRLQYQRKE